MFKYKHFAIITLYFLATPVLSEDYQSNSVFNHDYKCVAEEQGGFNHNATGHELTKFIVDEEFFLVHISNIPEQVILPMLAKTAADAINRQKDLSSQDLEALKRKELEKEYLQKRVFGTMTTERGSYFIREPQNDPNDAITYLRTNNCSTFKTDKYASINCYGDDPGRTFQFNVMTGRFTYSYAGTWHAEVKDGYYGDSATFAFGTCKQYYR